MNKRNQQWKQPKKSEEIKIFKNENIKKWKTQRDISKNKTGVLKLRVEKFNFELRKLLSFKKWRSLKSVKEYFVQKIEFAGYVNYCLKLSR